VDQGSYFEVTDEDENSYSTSHVEHVKPRSILPKPSVISGWDRMGNDGLDANGNPW